MALRKAIGLAARAFSCAMVAVALMAGPAAADNRLAWEAYDHGDFALALQLFAPSAEAGDADAQYGMALLLSDGLGVVQDRAAAVEWLERSAVQGHDQAMVNLGFHIDLGLGHPRDVDLAEHWYAQAAELGNLMARNNLAYMWALDRRNLDQALEIMKDVVGIVPEESSYLDTLGWVYYQMGRFAEAVGPICDAVTLEPGHPELRVHLGDVYWQLGRSVDAQYQWQRGMLLLQTPEALSDTGAAFAEGLGGEIAAQLAQRLAQGLPYIESSPGAAGREESLSPSLPDECSVPVV
ncbi:MAG: tetratricopeptide repeat protein [Alphaproteobacteria bacterium]